MKILVSMRTVENPTYHETRDAISRDWCRLFIDYGLLPILVPNGLDDPTGYFDLGARGLLLTGGDGMGPEGAPTPRDVTERALLDAAIARTMPVFGVCRGMQVINRHFGGRNAAVLPGPHVGTHGVEVSGYGRRQINSFHDHGVLADGLAPGLSAFATADDGVIEAIRHRDLTVTAIQWHPERPNPAADLDRALLTEWLQQCA